MSQAGYAPRQAAYHLLQDVLIKNTPLDQALNQNTYFNNLEGRDRSLVRMIVSTSLRHKGQIDALLLKVREKKINPPTTYLILYIGIVQLLWMKVPSHAAIDITVTLAEKENHTRLKGLVNAILRRIDHEAEVLLKDIDRIKSNIPDWLFNEWIDGYGQEEAMRISEASIQEASTDITLKEQNKVKEWAEKLHANILPTNSLRLKEQKDITQLEGYEAGAWWVQDAASALPVNLLPDDLTNKTVIDLCAAPGGKTMQLAARGANVIAVDRSANRLKRLKDNLDRTNLSQNVKVVVADGAMWRPEQPADIVLLDAPCSATGTLRRHPDLMHLKTANDVEKLAQLQAKLLNNTAKMIKGDGMLIYCTCSLQKKEGETQVESFLKSHSDFQTVPILKEKLKNLENALTDQGWIRLRPNMLADQGGIDGFFIAQMIKK
ncbi:MAG: 16S rRNA (cytosine(967)-C(5))-methyltransferase RsmB [Pseudomonadota bacterium]